MLKKIEPSERLIQLIDKIEFLEIVGNGYIQQKVDEQKKYTIYNYTTNNIDWLLNTHFRSVHLNKLLNKEKLSDTISNDITNISQEQFCDLLEEHLYLTGKNKLMELLPGIQKHLRRADITQGNAIGHFEGLGERDRYKTVISIGQYGELNHNSECAYDYIWDDKDNFILKQDISPYPEIERGYMLSTKRGPDDYRRYVVIDWFEGIVLECWDFEKNLPKKLNHSEEKIVMISNNKGDVLWTDGGAFQC